MKIWIPHARVDTNHDKNEEARLSKHVKTIRGHKYHGASRDEIISRLRRELQESRALLAQYDGSNRRKAVRDISEDLEDLENLSVFGWPKELTGFGGGARSGGRGDGKAAELLIDIESRLVGMHQDIRRFLNAREEEIRTGVEVA